MRNFSTLFILISIATQTFGQLTAWRFVTQSPNPSEVQTGMNANPITTVGAGTINYSKGFVAPSSEGGNAVAADAWTTSSSPDFGKYFEISVSASDVNDPLNFSGLELVVKSLANAPDLLQVRASVDGFTSSNVLVATASLAVDKGTFQAMNVPLLNSAFDNTTQLSIRFYGYNAPSSSQDTLIFDEIVFNSVTVLPVEWLATKVFMRSGAGVIAWATASEIDNAFFTVERSTDGFHFETVGVVEGAGDSYEVLNYEFTDETTPAGTLYYRIAQTDFSGLTTYSDIMTVENEVKSNVAIRLYPNPVVDWLQIDMENSDKTDVVAIFTASGELVRFEKVAVAQGSTIRVDVANLVKGVYWVRLFDGQRWVTSPFVKF